MNKLKIVVACLFLGGLLPAGAQSYDIMEKRFSQKELTAKDSAAFRAQGLQKVQSLFYKADLYTKNSGNLSNQAYIVNRLPDMFYTPAGDTLNLDPMLAAIATIQNKKVYVKPELQLSDEPGYLGRVDTKNTKPKLSYLLILKREPKKFGNREEVVWQVFLSQPVIE